MMLTINEILTKLEKQEKLIDKLANLYAMELITEKLNNMVNKKDSDGKNDGNKLDYLRR